MKYLINKFLCFWVVTRFLNNPGCLFGLLTHGVINRDKQPGCLILGC
jgi:hypothetical protein